ncbi:MAG: TetR/AcrR family transcriptional regulator [Myxococcaceae bacterium]
MVGRGEQKQKTHEEILTSSVRLLRERGISGASVAEVMKNAGLTVGGFYAHFDSKESLVATALRRAFRETWDVLLRAENGEPDVIRRVLKRYLSRGHRDHPELGCVLPAVVGEATHAGEPIRDAVVDVLETWSNDLEAHLQGDKGTRRQRALALIALMYGGLSLARAVRGTKLSDEILEACRQFGQASQKDS